MTREAFKFSGDDALNYERLLGPLLFEPSAQVFLSHLGSPDPRSVLEISCGTGRLTRHLPKYFSAGTQLLATDISPDMLAVAKKELANLPVEFQIADAGQLPFADASFDMTLCQHGIMFWPDKKQGFSEVFRTLRPGGRFVFACWDSTKNIPLISLIIEETVIPFFEDEEAARFRVPFSLHDPELVLEFLTASGFSSNNVFPVVFKSANTSYEDVVDAFFLKHALGRQLAGRDPAAVQPMAETMKKKLADRYGGDSAVFELKMLIGTGQK